MLTHLRTLLGTVSFNNYDTKIKWKKSILFLMNLMMFSSFLGQLSTSSSLFTYKEEESTSTFSNVNYKPMFLHNISFGSEALARDARALCGDDHNCLFDVAVTGDLSIGRSTKEINDNNFLNEKLLGKHTLKESYFF